MDSPYARDPDSRGINPRDPEPRDLDPGDTESDDDNIKTPFRNQNPGARLPGAPEPGYREPGLRNPDDRLRDYRLRQLGAVLDPDFVVQEVAANSIASWIGLRPGDQLLAVNGRELRSDEQLSTALNSGSRLLLTVSRNRRVANLLIRL
jgi:membrane-associated protease RseP (regulator of RpoE activity)